MSVSTMGSESDEYTQWDEAVRPSLETWLKFTMRRDKGTVLEAAIAHFFVQGWSPTKLSKFVLPAKRPKRQHGATPAMSTATMPAAAAASSTSRPAVGAYEHEHKHEHHEPTFLSRDHDHDGVCVCASQGPFEQREPERQDNGKSSSETEPPTRKTRPRGRLTAVEHRRGRRCHILRLARGRFGGRLHHSVLLMHYRRLSQSILPHRHL